MPSGALQRWFADRTPLLDEIEKAHRYVRGSGIGARTAMQQINQAYTLLLSAQFQAYCRDLHLECAVAFASPLANLDYRTMVNKSLLLNRKLDHGNPNPGNIGSDFGRFNLGFWKLVDAHHHKNSVRRFAIEEMYSWRNAIAHHDFTPSMLRAGQPRLHLVQVRDWRSACEGLAVSFDDVMRMHIQPLTGRLPW